MAGNILNLKKSTPISIRHGDNPFFHIQSALDRAMEDFYGSFISGFPTLKFEDLSIHPSIDIVEDKNTLKIEVELPGVGESDVKVSISDGILTIEGEKSISKQDKDKEKSYVMREIGYGYYKRSISLPEYVDTDKAKASFKKGMLWVEIPKKAAAKGQPRELKVEKIG